MGLLKFLFILTLFTFPLGQIARLQFAGGINITLFDAATLATGIVWLMYAFSKKKKAIASLTKPILFFAGAIIISLIANLFRYSGVELFIAALYGIRWVLFACLYFVVLEFDEPFKKKIPLFLTITGGVVLLLGYLQYVFYQDLRNLYYLGWDDHLYRMFSSFLDPNFAAGFFVLFFLFLLGRLGENPFTFTKEQILLVLLSLADFIAVFLTTSRSGLIMLAVGLLMYLILIGKKKWMFGFIGIIAVVLAITSPFFYIENINPFRTASSTARIESAGNAIKIIEKSPVFGIGFNAYRYAQQDAGITAPLTQFPAHSASGTDNSFLFVMATTGILGFGAFLYLLIEIVKLGMRKSEKRIIGKVLIASIIGLVVHSLFINSLFYPMLLFWLWMIVGLTDYT